jgi:hypothetical protein
MVSISSRQSEEDAHERLDLEDFSLILHYDQFPCRVLTLEIPSGFDGSTLRWPWTENISATAANLVYLTTAMLKKRYIHWVERASGRSFDDAVRQIARTIPYIVLGRGAEVYWTIGILVVRVLPGFIRGQPTGLNLVAPGLQCLKFLRLETFNMPVLQPTSNGLRVVLGPIIGRP